MVKKFGSRSDKQRGFGVIPLVAAAIIGILAIGLYFMQWRLERSQGEKAKVEAAYAVLADRVEAQNRAVEKLEEASKTAQEGSRIAVARVRAEGQGITKEVERLRQRLAEAEKTGKLTCSEAINQIKQGLK